MTRSVRFPDDVWELIMAFVPRDIDAYSPTSEAFLIGTELFWIHDDENFDPNGDALRQACFPLRSTCGVCRRMTRIRHYYFGDGRFEYDAPTCGDCWRVIDRMRWRVRMAIRAGRLP